MRPSPLRSVRRSLDDYARVLFSEGPFPFFAFGVVIAIWAMELAMNLRSGQGWVSILHFVVIGPLWLAATGLTVYALVRRLTDWHDRPRP